MWKKILWVCRIQEFQWLVASFPCGAPGKKGLPEKSRQTGPPTGEGQQDSWAADWASELSRELLKRNEPVVGMGHNRVAFCVDQQWGWMGWWLNQRRPEWMRIARTRPPSTPPFYARGNLSANVWGSGVGGSSIWPTRWDERSEQRLSCIKKNKVMFLAFSPESYILVLFREQRISLRFSKRTWLAITA